MYLERSMCYAFNNYKDGYKLIRLYVPLNVKIIKSKNKYKDNCRFT